MPCLHKPREKLKDSTSGYRIALFFGPIIGKMSRPLKKDNIFSKKKSIGITTSRFTALLEKYQLFGWKKLSGRESLFFENLSFPLLFNLPRISSACGLQRVVNPYRKISFQNVEFKVSGVPIREKVPLRIVPDKETNLAEIRLWYKSQLVGVEKMKCSALSLVQY